MTTVRQVLAAKSAAIYAVEPETAVLEAIRAMAEHRVGALLVMRGAELDRRRFRARLCPQGDPPRARLQ